ncbi:MAG: lplA [Bacteroidetes bacterium]|nr:lplA [Bacteroidota bacterium]
MKIMLIESDSTDPWYNLALEEHLLETLQTGECILYLWQNDQTVVIGANQNPWKECNLKLLEEDGGRLARRISGGGAVYHDLGNLNFSFLLGRHYYDFDKQIKLIISALERHNIKAAFTGRNDILVNGKKLSGNAFYYAGDKVLHHGTILLDCVFDKMAKYLQVSERKIHSKGIESVRSRVINLKEIIPDITIPVLKESIKTQFMLSYGSYEQMSCIDLDLTRFDPLYKKHASWAWRFGDTPDYQIAFSNYFSCGEVSIGLTLEKGIIGDAKVYSDALDVRMADKIKNFLMGLPFDSDVIKQKYNENEETCKYQDVIAWLAEEISKL